MYYCGAKIQLFFDNLDKKESFFVFGPLLLAFEVGDVLEHGVNVAVDFVALAHAVYATYYQTYNAADDYAE